MQDLAEIFIKLYIPQFMIRLRSIICYSDCYISSIGGSMPSANHLAPRGKRQIYYVRLAVPSHLRSAVGACERIKSLGTSDHRAAERLALPFLDQWKSEFEALERAGTSEVDLRSLAVRTAYEELKALLNQPWASLSPDRYEEMMRKREAQLREFTRQNLNGDFSRWEGVADRSLQRFAPRALGDLPKRRQFLEFLSQAGIDAIREDYRRRNGELEAGPSTALVRDELAREAESVAPGRSLIDLYDEYAAQRLLEKRKRPDTIAQDRKVVVGFSTLIGMDRAVNVITMNEIREWLKAKRSVPAGYSKMRKFAGLPLREAVDRATGSNLRKISPKTLNKELSALSALFKWLKTNGFRDGPNPCDGLFLDTKKGDNARPPYSTEQLNVILSSPLFTGFARDNAEHELGCKRADDWCYWIPLVCLFTGARVSEIAQLRVGDVVDDPGGMLIYIRHDTEVGLSTKSGKVRVAPVHAKLAELGFLAFHAARKRAVADADHAQLFPQMEANNRGNFGAKASRFWRDYLRDIGIKTDPEGGDGLGTHSFRHALADRFREEGGLLDNQIAVALGHSLKSTTGGYGRVSQATAKALRAMFGELRFDGVEFDHLLPGARP